MLNRSKRKTNAKADEVFSSIKKQLQNIDSEIALEYLTWLDRKTAYLNQSIKIFFKINKS